VADLGAIVDVLPYLSMGLGATGMAVATFLFTKSRQRPALSGSDRLRLLTENKVLADRLDRLVTAARAECQELETRRAELAEASAELERYIDGLKQRLDEARAESAAAARGPVAGGIAPGGLTQGHGLNNGHSSQQPEPKPAAPMASVAAGGGDFVDRDAVTQQVLELHRAGRNHVQIAQATGLHMGVVELMLALARDGR
jgi:hypothetical protein